MNILSIETSCDETAIAVISFDNDNLNVLSNIVSSQVKLHAKWGGVVPNLAAREHLKNILPVLKEALDTTKITPKEIDLIAVTAGPGLIPALLVGTNTAKTLAYKWKKPLLGIHHIEGHIYANFIGEISNSQFPISKQFSSSNNQISKQKHISSKLNNLKFNKNYKLKIKNSSIKFPVLCLVVSGGHTQLVLMKDHLQYEIVGQTLDDAAGEAFDKVARILDLGYPGGPAIAAAAAANFKFPISNFQTISNDKISKSKTNSSHKIKLPRPMLHSKDFNFSFSGLKTAVLYQMKKFQENKSKIDNWSLVIEEMACEFQQAAIDVLVHKTIKAAQQYNPKTIMLAGGVSANKELRKQLGKNIEEKLPATSYIIPDISLTGDNAAMIASAAAFRWQKMSAQEKENAQQNWKNLEADANLKLG
ncbi:MAG: putative tRNA threonylcarbamoyladenosine biosynthesis protein Gcp [Candidatus Moranbacteria bacterium GW2011_GWE2_35_2-]|nr:MAG: putative tRNA threonylcarbamoyladenosine biosynthesis protein Gcp [Candidatus Moranbacteria bacterium GW2011_GWE2_35_2-]KKQ04786.1 MAG: putative tRNA threonylcarbamoyladenosine biosynthesis protein Gcp [Candidatus Moranbacteria bacterium GW2011_GWF1_36_4]KKQ22548.1 MAG: putative tRNA threonylcarbamoyladenosine biosynthesis protein Gcp [Candidatus Moranbacteria bacterium GW2011_GWF2_37_11]KKQ29617.1 MAG: putative tRNA threonylcarbamoyladenosine biosynthesis protein Gcp [Candidatus Moranba